MAKTNWYANNVLKAADAAIYKALQKSGAVVAARGRSNVPVGIEVRGTAKRGRYAGKYYTERTPGTLKKSIRWKMIRKKKKVQVIAGNRREAYYAWFVEKGTSRTMAQPYMRPALAQSTADIMLAFSYVMD